MGLVFIPLLTVFAIADGFGYYDGMSRGTLTEGLTPLAAATGGVFSLGYEPARGAVTNPAALVLAEGAQLEAGLSPGSWECSHIYPFPARDRKTTGLYLGGLFAGFVAPLSGRWRLGAGAAKVSDYRMSANIVEYEDEQHGSTMGGSFGLEIPIGRVALIASVGWNGADRRNSLFGDYYISRIETTYTTVSLGMRAGL